MTKVKTDLHVHINGKANKKEFVEFLKKAESDGIKKLCLLEHDKLTNVDIIEDLLKHDEIKKYYTGDLIVGVEYNAVIDAHHKNADGSNYDGYISHILTYMTLDDAKKMKQNAILYGRNVEEDYKSDYKTLTQKIVDAFEKNGLTPILPTLLELKAMNRPHIVKDLHDWIVADEKRKNLYVSALHLTGEQIESDSAFIRQLAQTPGAILFYSQASIPKLSELIDIIRNTAPSAKLVIAHPAYMSNDFVTQNYLDTLMNMPQITQIKNFDGIETRYYLNTPEEDEMIDKYADKYDLIKTGGTDSYGYNEKIMRFPTPNGIYLFVPSYGRTMGRANATGKVRKIEENGAKTIEYTDDSAGIYLDKDLFSELSVTSQKNITNHFENEK